MRPHLTLFLVLVALASSCTFETSTAIDPGGEAQAELGTSTQQAEPSEPIALSGTEAELREAIERTIALPATSYRLERVLDEVGDGPTTTMITEGRFSRSAQVGMVETIATDVYPTGDERIVKTGSRYIHDVVWIFEWSQGDGRASGIAPDSGEIAERWRSANFDRMDVARQLEPLMDVSIEVVGFDEIDGGTEWLVQTDAAAVTPLLGGFTNDFAEGDGTRELTFTVSPVGHLTAVAAEYPLPASAPRPASQVRVAKSIGPIDTIDVSPPCSDPMFAPSRRFGERLLCPDGRDLIAWERAALDAYRQAGSTGDPQRAIARAHALCVGTADRSEAEADLTDEGATVFTTLADDHCDLAPLLDRDRVAGPVDADDWVDMIATRYAASAAWASTDSFESRAILGCQKVLAGEHAPHFSTGLESSGRGLSESQHLELEALYEHDCLLLRADADARQILLRARIQLARVVGQNNLDRIPAEGMDCMIAEAQIRDPAPATIEEYAVFAPLCIPGFLIDVHGELYTTEQVSASEARCVATALVDFGATNLDRFYHPANRPYIPDAQDGLRDIITASCPLDRAQLDSLPLF